MGNSLTDNTATALVLTSVHRFKQFQFGEGQFSTMSSLEELSIDLVNVHNSPSFLFNFCSGHQF